MSALLVALAALTAHGAPTEEAEVVDYRGFLDQGKFFVKKGWYDDAEQQLEAASRHPDGKVDPEVWFLLAKVRYELADLPGARAAADQALTWSRDPTQAEVTREWLDFLDQRFGMVRLVPPRAGLASVVRVELRGTILDPELKAWYARAQDRLAGPVDLPLTLGLPAGYTYAFDEAEVRIEAGQTTDVPIAVRQVALQSLELSLSAGVGSWTGDDLKHLFPAPGAELGLLVPIGPLVIGARAGGVLQPRETPRGDAAADVGHTVGFELGVEDPREDAVQLRVGASIRHTTQTGLRMGCEEQACTLFGDGKVVEGASYAVVPGLWTSAAWLDRSSSTSFGVGLRLVGERAFGRATGDMHLFSAPGTQTSILRNTLAQPESWQAWGIRGLVDVSLAL